MKNTYALPLEKTANTLGHRMGENRKFGARRCLNPTKPCSFGAIDIDHVQEQHAFPLFRCFPSLVLS